MTQHRKDPKRQRSYRRLAVEGLELRRVFDGAPFGAFDDDTAEYMLGRVAVTPVFMESNGQLDPSSENWTQAHIDEVLTNIREGLQWWVDTLAAMQTDHQLEFVLDTTYATNPVATQYEPISRRSDDYTLWVREFLTSVGQSTAIQTGIRAFNHAQRVKLDTDWSFTIFVVNSKSDADGMFAAGGTFSRAFAFAGGLFEVVPSTRPPSTFAHETGHMFWARDEYVGGGNFTQLRGYYNTQNTNAADNPTTGFNQQPSIMASGSLLDTAYRNNVSPASTLAMIGWQDTDRDGIFDVLDVPMSLTGSGYLDTATNQYKFQGRAVPQTLPNLNPEGFRNDITINRIRRIEYRLDGGAWQLFSQPNQYAVDLNLSIPVPSSANTIEIRAFDDKSQVESNVFLGRLARTDATLVPGINGFTWVDANKNGLRDVGESGEAGWTVNLFGPNGETLNLRNTIEPDTFPEGQLTNGFSSLVSLQSLGSDADGRVGVFTDTATSTGTKTFRAFSRASQSYLSVWTANSRRLQISFTTPTSLVELDAIGAAATSYGRLEAYNSSGRLLARYTTSALANGAVEKMVIARGAADIAYVIAGGHTVGNVRLDNLRFGPETTTTTGARGQYAFPSLPAGNYRVQISRSDLSPLSPAGGRQNVVVTANNATTDVDFGFVVSTSSWQNASDRFDVNLDGMVSPIDALMIIDDLSRRGSRELTSSTVPPPFVDVSGDKAVSPVDVLLVIDFLVRRSNGGGEGETAAQPTGYFGDWSNDVDWGEVLGEAEYAEILQELSQEPIPVVTNVAVNAAGTPLTVDFTTTPLDAIDWAHVLDPAELVQQLGYEFLSGEMLADLIAASSHDHDHHDEEHGENA